MIQKINASSLSQNYQWRMGPYIYYYKENREDGNKILAQNISEISKTYQKIRVLEINWESQIYFHGLTSREYLFKIFLLVNGKRYELNGLEIQNVKDMFIKAVNYYNEKVDILAKNVGSKGKRIPRNQRKYRAYEPYNNMSVYERQRLEVRRRSVLKQKIKIGPDGEPLSNSSSNVKSPDKSNTIKSATLEYRKIAPKLNINNFPVYQQTTYSDGIGNNTIQESIRKHQLYYKLSANTTCLPIQVNNINNLNSIYSNDLQKNGLSIKENGDSFGNKNTSLNKSSPSKIFSSNCSQEKEANIKKSFSPLAEIKKLTVTGNIIQRPSVIVKNPSVIKNNSKLYTNSKDEKVCRGSPFENKNSDDYLIHSRIHKGKRRNISIKKYNTHDPKWKRIKINSFINEKNNSTLPETCNELRVIKRVSSSLIDKNKPFQEAYSSKNLENKYNKSGLYTSQNTPIKDPMFYYTYYKCKSNIYINKTPFL